MAVEWLYQDHGFERGSVSGEELKRLAAQGTVIPSTPIRRISQGEQSPWRRAGEVKGLFQGDVSSLIGGEICGDCGKALRDGKCPVCSAPPPPPPTPQPQPSFDPAAYVRDAEACRRTEDQPQVVQATLANDKPLPVVVVGLKIPVGDAIGFIVTFWVASAIIGAVLWLAALLLFALLSGMAR